MLTFRAMTPEILQMLKSRYPGCESRWGRLDTQTESFAWAEYAGCLIVRSGGEDGAVYEDPFPGPDGEIDAALAAAEQTCMEQGVTPVLCGVTEERLTALLERYPYVRINGAADGKNGRTYRLEAFNELQVYARALPELHTQRLTLSALKEKDAPAYNALLLDAERNRWWGFDDAAALRDEEGSGSFLDAAREEFHRCRELSLAVRLDGTLIGETVFHHFNFRGEAELGCRIAASAAGHGYGTEAFAAAACWALYQLRLERLTAKCFRDNEASRKMLLSCMMPTGSDGTFYYFKREL